MEFGNIQAVSKFNDKYKELLYEDEEVFKLKQEELISKIVKKYGGSRATIMRVLSNYGIHKMKTCLFSMDSRATKPTGSRRKSAADDKKTE